MVNLEMALLKWVLEWKHEVTATLVSVEINHSLSKL